MRRTALVLLATVAVVSSASAQQKRRVRGRPFPQLSYFDRSLRWSRARPARAARLGYFLTDHLAIEAEGAWVPAKGRSVDVVLRPAPGEAGAQRSGR